MLHHSWPILDSLLASYQRECAPTLVSYTPS